MKRKAIVNTAIASLLIGTSLAACSGGPFRPSATAARANPDRLAAQVEQALARRDGGLAVILAESAVEAAPQDARHRQLLGRAYVAAGRFVSAETALNDAMTLGQRDARTIVTLALVKVALGQDRAARDLLASHTDILPATDYGLAMAMAGDAGEGVRILSEVIHDPSSNAQTRQNLAYAYALAGRWKDARMMAEFDLDPSAASERITHWAQTAAPGLSQQRVAALMGVTIDGADAGQPVALALAPQPQSQQEQMANAAPVAPAAEPALVEIAASQAAPAIQSIANPEFAAPIIQAPASPVRVAVSRQAATPRAYTPVRSHEAAISRAGSGNWVVQLGAYDNAAIAKEKWMEMARRNHGIANLPVMTSQIKVNGATFARLAVGGFADRADAASLCRSIQSRRGQCFVRENAPDATPQRWAINGRGPHFASR